MKLNSWKYNVIDLNSVNDFIQNPKLSILANSVDFLNLECAKNVPENLKVLEVGCGVQSLFYDNLKTKNNWDGIDVFQENEDGIKSIATKIASVENIPFSSGYFDYVLSNQSIEHWREYGVSIIEGLSEIRRVTAIGGKVVINFPIHLHGDKIFVKGNFKKINECFLKAGLKIIKRKAVVDSSLPNYQGWRHCGFPDFYVQNLAQNEKTSYVVEYEATPDETFKVKKINLKKSNLIKKRQNTLQLNAHHGLKFFVWKFFNKLATKILKK